MAGEVMDQGEAGEYRTMRVKVGNYVPPPPERVEPMMFELIELVERTAQRCRPS